MYAPGHELGPAMPDMCCRHVRLDEAVTRGCDSSITAHARDAARSGTNEAETFRVSGGCRADPPACDGLVIVG